MSKESDTAMSKEYRQALIEKNISIEICKECTSAFITNNQLQCKAENPEVHTCNLLKIFYIP